jgi:transcriptional regulator with XRE-family HTH domain
MPQDAPYDTTPIEEAIKKEGYSYQEAAVYAGLSPTTLTQIRKADEGVKVKTLRQLAKSLKLKVEIRFIPTAG